MKRVIIICEGQTEKEFCKEVLFDHFFSKKIHIQTPLIKHSGGGIVHWKTLQKQIETHIKQDKEAKITLLIDYYGIKPEHEFPKWQESHTIVNKNERMTALEMAMKEAVGCPNFFPYIQLHEFEGLLFHDITIFKNNFLPSEADFIALSNIINDFPNVEDINDNPKTAPSKRLEKHIKGYNKPVYGALLAKEIGLSNIRRKAPRFNHWIEKIESI